MAIDPQFGHCADGAAAAAGWDGEKDAHAGSNLESAFRTVKTKMQDYIDQGLSPRDAALRAGKEAAEGARAQASVVRRNQLLNLTKRVAKSEQAVARVQALIERRAGETVPLGKDDPVFDALHSMLDGSSTITPEGGERASTAAKMHAQASGMQAAYEADLRKVGLLDAARDANGKFADDIHRELYEQSMRDSGKPARVGLTGDQQALKIAEIARKYQVMQRANANAEGADIGDVPGYMGMTMHGADPIYRAGFDTWSRDLLAGADPSTFAGMDGEARGRFLQDLFGAFVTGRHMDDGKGVGTGDPQFTGPGNLAKRMSQSRVIQWKDADSWLDYQRKYSTGSFQEKMVNSIRKGARQHALLMDWGTSPKAEFENLMQRTLDHFQKSGDLETVRKFTPTHRASLMSLFGDIDGSNSIPANSMGARVATNVRDLISMAKLGGVLFRHSSLFASVPYELHYHGTSYLEGVRTALTNFLGPFEGAQRKEVASLIGAGVDNMGFAGNLNNGVGGSDDVPGVIGRLYNTFVRLTGLPTAIRVQKEGIGLMLAHRLAQVKNSAFEDLSPGQRSAFLRYTISPADWEALRTAPDLPQDGRGREYLTPDAAQRSPAELSARERDALTLKLRAYYVDSADRATITPSATDRTIARFGANRDPNTIVGQAGRFLAQFHTWPVALGRIGFGREWNGRTGMGNRIGGTLGLMGALTAASYAGDALLGIMQGQEPPPVTPEHFANSFARGGALGLLGDYLAGGIRSMVEDTPRPFIGSALGPTVGGPAWDVADTIAGAWKEANNGNAKPLDAALANIITHNAPGANLFYLKAALHYLFLDSLQETMNPGYLERHNQFVQQKEGISHFSPSVPVLGMLGALDQGAHLPTFGR